MHAMPYQPIFSDFDRSAREIAFRWLETPVLKPENISSETLSKTLQDGTAARSGWHNEAGTRVWVKPHSAKFAAAGKIASDLGALAGLPVATEAIISHAANKNLFWTLSLEPFPDSKPLKEAIYKAYDSGSSQIERLQASPIFGIATVLQTAVANHDSDINAGNIVGRWSGDGKWDACIIDLAQAEYVRRSAEHGLMFYIQKSAIKQTDVMIETHRRLAEIPDTKVREIFTRLPNKLLAPKEAEEKLSAYRHNLDVIGRLLQAPLV